MFPLNSPLCHNLAGGLNHERTQRRICRIGDQKGDFGEAEDGHQDLPIRGEPNSVTQKQDKEGNVIAERYYDENGYVYLDIDYTDHGNPKNHPVVPHQHRWEKDGKGKQTRKDWEEIAK